MTTSPSASAPVYLVDDDTGVREAVTFLLGSRGLDVRAHASGPSLLDALRRAPPPLRGVFLLDIRMEPMSGLRLHEELMALNLRNPVLFLTGHGDIPMAVDALKKGAFDFLEKPYSDNALADRIEQALAVAAAMHQGDALAAEREARFALGDQDSVVRPLGSELYRRAECKTLMLKLGDRGMMVFRGPSDETGNFFIIDSFAERTVDSVGAGDALLAYATLAMVATRNEAVAGILGAFAAGIECEQDGNVPVTRQDMLDKIDTVERRVRYS